MLIQWGKLKNVGMNGYRQGIIYIQSHKFNILLTKDRICKEYRWIVEEGAKTAPTSTIFIYMLGSKAMGSSLTSQIAAKSAANCDARLKP